MARAYTDELQKSDAICWFSTTFLAANKAADYTENTDDGELGSRLKRWIRKILQVIFIAGSLECSRACLFVELVVGGFLGDEHVVDMTFAQRRFSDLHEAGPGLQFFDCGDAAIAHSGT